ncbi:MAG: acyl-CoA thioesterase [Alphaproteobacteria bacterium]|nr:acyl-CoA thioesterase [Alphaproteobacteria bacterium]
MNAAGLGAVSFETAFERPIEPAQSDFDELGHVNNAVYLRWAQEIAIAHWRLVSDPAMLRAYLWVVLRHEVDYRDQIRPGDAVMGRTWLGKAQGPRFDRYIDIRKPGAPRAAASVKSTWCLLDAETRRPRRVGADILQAFQVPG